MDVRRCYDILSHIFDYLNIPDLINVSLVCRVFHEVSHVFLYHTLFLTWGEIEEIISTKLNEKRLSVMKSVHIGADGRGEWCSSSKLPALVEESHGNLCDLHVSCALRSSGWFKYIGKPLNTITCLTLTPGISMLSYEFDFAHIVHTVPALEHISLGNRLGGFEIDPTIDGGLENLKSIRVENCEWKYPSKLLDVAANSELQSLEILLTIPMHHFAFSERLKTEFSALPTSLRRLTVAIVVGKKLNWNPLQKSPPLANLESARLQGFEYNFHDPKKGQGPAKFPKLRAFLEE